MKQIKAHSYRTPVYRDAGFVFQNIETAETASHLKTAEQYKSDSIYTRYANPTVCAAEEVIKKLEGCKWSLLTSSGMSAIDVALSLFQKGTETGCWLFFHDIYGGTIKYRDEILKNRRGLKVKVFAYEGETEVFDLAKLEDALKEHTPEVLFFEAISNPLLIVPDALKIIKSCKERGIKVIVDNTFATPLLWNPLEDGADIVVHSATKYFGGHGNLTAGVVCGNDEEDLLPAALEYRKYVGCILSPDDAYRLETQLMTFELRFREQCQNALRLAEFLYKREDKIARVRYPGLAEHHSTSRQAADLFSRKAEKLFGKNCPAYGAMVTFELKGGRKACDRFVETIGREDGEHLSIPYIPTLGDAKSILLHPSSFFAKTEPPFSEGMIRFSVGCERFEDLKKTFENAFDAIGL